MNLLSDLALEIVPAADQQPYVRNCDANTNLDDVAIVGAPPAWQRRSARGCGAHVLRPIRSSSHQRWRPILLD